MKTTVAADILGITNLAKAIDAVAVGYMRAAAQTKHEESFEPITSTAPWTCNHCHRLMRFNVARVRWECKCTPKYSPVKERTTCVK